MNMDTGRMITADFSMIQIKAIEPYLGLKELADKINHDLPEALPKIEEVIEKHRELMNSLADFGDYMYPAIIRLLEASLQDSL